MVLRFLRFQFSLSRSENFTFRPVEKFHSFTNFTFDAVKNFIASFACLVGPSGLEPPIKKLISSLTLREKHSVLSFNRVLFP